MRIILAADATARDVGLVIDLARETTGNPDGVTFDKLDGRIVVTVAAENESVDPAAFQNLNGVEAIDNVEPVYSLAGLSKTDTTGTASVTIIEIPFVDARIGGEEFVVMAGPCAVENVDDLISTARTVKKHGAKFLRGGVYKPRTSPYSFQGLGDEGLEMLKRVREEIGIGIITEAMAPERINTVGEIADIIQIGSRNMQNFPLLKEAGRQSKPVLLKRGMSATLEEWLGAAEYVLAEGNPNVILCERGIRTFSRHSRHTLDLGVLPVVRERSSLPVIIDPSHATGMSSRVPAMAKAALAAGADGLLVEVHPDPSRALSDGYQTLSFDEYNNLMNDLVKIAGVIGRSI